MINFFKKKEKDIEFIDRSRRAYQMHPVQRAKDVPVFFMQDQIKSTGKLDFVQCPGMVDVRNYGYIIPAWDDINILGNESGCMVTMGSQKRETVFVKPKHMDKNIARGIVTPSDNVPLDVFHLECPWNIVSNKTNLSAFIIAPPFHAKFLDDIHVYPGIVDYNKFTSANLIFSVKRKCNITIAAGDPLLQVFPFYNLKDGITAGYGPSDDYQDDKFNSVFSSTKQFYRKYIQIKKNMKLTENHQDKPK